MLKEFWFNKYVSLEYEKESRWEALEWTLRISFECKANYVHQFKGITFRVGAPDGQI